MDKVIDIEERIPSLRERRKKRTNRKFVALLLLLLLLLAVMIYSQTPYSKIQHFTIEGASLYEEEHYLQESGLTDGDSMWSFREVEVEERLAALPWVEEARVERDWPTGVELTVKEYDQIAFLERGSSYETLLVNGFASDRPVDAIDGPVISGFEDTAGKADLAAQLTQLESPSYQLISQIVETERVGETVYATLYMTDGNEVLVVLPTLAEKLNYYPSVTSQLEEGQKGIFDMEVGIFFRSYDEVYGDGSEGESDEEAEPES